MFYLGDDCFLNAITGEHLDSSKFKILDYPTFPKYEIRKGSRRVVLTMNPPSNLPLSQLGKFSLQNTVHLKNSNFQSYSF